jgi:hypothetical protein
MFKSEQGHAELQSIVRRLQALDLKYAAVAFDGSGDDGGFPWTGYPTAIEGLDCLDYDANGPLGEDWTVEPNRSTPEQREEIRLLELELEHFAETYALDFGWEDGYGAFGLVLFQADPPDVIVRAGLRTEDFHPYEATWSGDGVSANENENEE